MTYENVREARFLRRPNRFIAHVLLGGEETVCHVKNTGRCRELLLPGATVYVQQAANPARKTGWDLIAVHKGERLINMDAAAPNAVFCEWLREGGLGFVPTLVRPECQRGDSRFDFYFEHDGKPAFAEVKGVTLEEDGVVLFPDAPTERGVKHLHGLIRCVQDGFEAWAVFVVQMRGVKYFEPNRDMHPAFAEALREARDAGVHLLALDCEVSPESLRISEKVPIQLSFRIPQPELNHPPRGLAKSDKIEYSFDRIT